MTGWKEIFLLAKNLIALFSVEGWSLIASGPCVNIFNSYSAKCIFKSLHQHRTDALAAAFFLQPKIADIKPFVAVGQSADAAQKSAILHDGTAMAALHIGFNAMFKGISINPTFIRASSSLVISRSII